MSEPTRSHPGPSDPPPVPGACASCGAPADDLARVRRVYVTPGAWGSGADEPAADRVDVLDEVEPWCFPCRSSYPHQPVA